MTKEQRIFDATLCLSNDQEAYMLVTELASKLSGILKAKYDGHKCSPDEAEAGIRDAIIYLVENGACEKYEPQAV